MYTASGVVASTKILLDYISAKQEVAFATETTLTTQIIQKFTNSWWEHILWTINRQPFKYNVIQSCFYLSLQQKKKQTINCPCKSANLVAWSCGTLLSTLITRCHNSTQQSLNPTTCRLIECSMVGRWNLQNTNTVLLRTGLGHRNSCWVSFS